MVRAQNPNLEILLIAIKQLGELADEVEAVSGHMPTDATSQVRVSIILGSIKQIIEIV